MARRVEELPIFQKASEFCSAVNALVERAAFGRNSKLRDQITEASDSITANMREGFEQPTDAAFNRYLFIAKGSLGEVLARLATAHAKRCIGAEELASHTAKGEELGRMLGGFIKYLARSDFKHRGRHNVSGFEIKHPTTKDPQIDDRRSQDRRMERIKDSRIKDPGSGIND